MAIETNDGDVLALVQDYCSHLAADNEGTFASFTAPQVEDLARLVDVTATEILAWINAAGYDSNTTNWTDASIDFVGWYNVIGTCYRIELMHPGMNASTAQNERFDIFRDIYDKFREQIKDGSILTGLLPQLGALQPKFTARLVSEKDAERLDTSTVKPFFSRDKFRNPWASPLRDREIVDRTGV